MKKVISVILALFITSPVVTYANTFSVDRAIVSGYVVDHKPPVPSCCHRFD